MSWLKQSGEVEEKLYTYVVYSTTQSAPEDPEGGDEFGEPDTSIEDQSSATLEEIAQSAKRYGINPRSKQDATDWWESEYSQDYSSGESTQYSLHVKFLSDYDWNQLNVLLGGEPTRLPYQELDQVPTVSPDAEFDRLIKIRDDGQITPQQFEDKSRRLFGEFK